jgi:OOP family OmpA-OmpF porin
MKTIALAAILTAFAAAPAVAHEGAYIVGSVGQAYFDINKGDIDNALTSAGLTGFSSSLKKSDTAYKLELGYKYNQNLAVEVGYVDLGKATYTASLSGVTANASVKPSGFKAAVVGILPIDKSFSVFGKVGAIAAKVDASVLATGPGGSLSLSDSSTKGKATWGFGATYNINNMVGIRAEFEQFVKLGDTNTTGKTADVNLINVGIVVGF